MNEKHLPPREFFDEGLATQLVGKKLLVGITHQHHKGGMLRRTQVFGHVVVADRNRGICIREDQGKETWFPPDTRGIKPAPPGEYRNHATGEVVKDPDYLATWTITAPPAKQDGKV
jgi:hypothetical protein